MKKKKGPGKWDNCMMYFILIDRFYSADRSNNDQGLGEFNPHDDNCFQGGDLRGITEKLSYIKSMGFDAIWITPPVYNQWINPDTPCRGYHGYWAYDFTKVDPHFGTIDDYKELVRRAHKLGLKVVQDIVVNHTGNYFTVDASKYDPADPRKGWKPCEGAFPPDAPPKAPDDHVFRMNNPNVEEHRKAAVYNFTPNMNNFGDRTETLTYSICDLDDINLENPLAARRMAEIYRHWIETVGVDGFRVDTVYYTPEKFYGRFLHSRDPSDPGMKPFAAQKGIRDFFVFGEVWSYDYAAINKYIMEDGQPGLDSAIDFPLADYLAQIFYKKLPTRKFVKYVEARRLNPGLWVSFLDNHDVERMMSRADWPSVKQSLVALFTLPGIPCVYYGTEHGFKKLRQNMFDHKYYARMTEQSRFLRKCLAMRKKEPAFSRGEVRIVSASAQCGVLAYETGEKGAEYLVVFNTSSDRMVMELPGPFASYKTVMSSHRARSCGSTLQLDACSYYVFRSRTRNHFRKKQAKKPVFLALDGAADSVSGKIQFKLVLSGASAVKKLGLLCDGNHDRRIEITDFKKNPRIGLETGTIGNGRHVFSLLAEMKNKSCVLSRPLEVVVANSYNELSSVSVPHGQRRGIHGNVAPPADASYRGQLDIKRIECLGTGRDLRLVLHMDAVTNDWKPPNGFDHVYFSVFFGLPHARGRRFLPKLGHCPKGFEFNAGFLLYGWGTIAYSADDATENEFGSAFHAEISQKVDTGAGTITFDFPHTVFDQGVFGRMKSFEGMKIYITTWDGYLARFHEVKKNKDNWNFSVTDAMPPGHVPRIYNHALVEIGRTGR